MWRLGATEKADGASTNDRKIIPPTHTISESSMRKRRKVIETQFSVLN
jgi:hypothetical protein